MILRNLVVQEVVNYFKGEDWTYFMNQLARGKAVRNAHVYMESIIDVNSMQKVLERYFASQGFSMQRQIIIQAMGRGLFELHNIHPGQDMGCINVFMKYSKDKVLAPRVQKHTISSVGHTVEIWDDEFMKKLHARYKYKTTLTGEDEKDLIAYFNSPDWKAPLLFITWGSAMHFHAVVETSIHPDIILEYGIKALEAQHWELSRAFTWAIPMKGFDQATLKFLVKKPEVCPEIECYFNPDVSIVPGAESVRGKGSTSDTEDITRARAGLEYIELDDEAVKEIVEALK